MGYGPGMFGMGGFGHIIGAFVGALLCFFIFLVIVGLIFLLVRFLLAATTAAHIYIAKNSTPVVVTRPTATTAPVAPTATIAASAKAAPKPRTAKPPAA